MELKVRLSDELVARLKEVAETAEVPPEEYAAELLRIALEDDWADAYAAMSHYDRTGEYYPAEEVMAEFRGLVEAGLKQRGRQSA